VLAVILVDLLALQNGAVWLIQCKINGKLSRQERLELTKLAERVGARAFLVSRDGRQLKFEDIKRTVDESLSAMLLN
jgi:Holliday junction resolvase